MRRVGAPPARRPPTARCDTSAAGGVYRSMIRPRITVAGIAPALLAVWVVAAPGTASVGGDAHAATAQVRPPIVSVVRHGGLCISGSECRSTFRITDTIVTGDGYRARRLKPAERAELLRALKAFDPAYLAAHPFTGTCPIAYDGQESSLPLSRRQASARVVHLRPARRARGAGDRADPRQLEAALNDGTPSWPLLLLRSFRRPNPRAGRDRLARRTTPRAGPRTARLPRSGGTGSRSASPRHHRSSF